MKELKKRCKVGGYPLDNLNDALKRWYDAERPGLVFKDYIEGNAVIPSPADHNL